jgi:hypothetical protein
LLDWFRTLAPETVAGIFHIESADTTPAFRSGTREDIGFTRSQHSFSRYQVDLIDSWFCIVFAHRITSLYFFSDARRYDHLAFTGHLFERPMWSSLCYGYPSFLPTCFESIRP